MLLAYTKIVNVKGYGQSTSNVCYKEEHSSRYTQIMNRILFDSLRHHGCWSCSAISQDSRQANWGLVKVSSRVNTTKGKLKTGQGYGRTKAIGTVNAHKDHGPSGAMAARSSWSMNKIKKPDDSRKNRSSVFGPRRVPILGLPLYTQEASYPVVCWKTLTIGFLGKWVGWRGGHSQSQAIHSLVTSSKIPKSLIIVSQASTGRPQHTTAYCSPPNIQPPFEVWRAKG